MQKLWQAVIKLGIGFLLLSSLFVSPVLAQTYTQGYARYTRGDFQGAIEIFRSTLARKRPSTTEERAQLFKYMGISHYMLGERREAARSFRSGLLLNPNLSIESKEVLDESVIEFFQEVVTRVRRSSDPPREAIVDAATVIINSNVDAAEILIDGKVIGRANQSFQTKPGVSEVEVRAPGYTSRQVRLTIRPKQTHRFDVILRRDSSDPSLARQSGKQRSNEGRPKRIVLPGEHEISGMTQAETNDRRQSNPAPEIPIPLPPSDNENRAGQSSIEPASRSSQGSSFSIVSLMPFGAGQFRNGQYLLGSVFAISEGTLLAFYYQSILDERATRATASEFIARENREGNVSTEELEEFRNEANRILLNEQKQQQAYLTGFSILWLTGIVHAIITAPSPQQQISRIDEKAGGIYAHSASDTKSSRIEIAPTPRGGLALQLSLRF